ncbi:SIS domain-containing protein [Saccharata proteae CBS 121410]|uniref:SIS domain-containing protein n=1 Tax=Saccharata proteae CBS 121410 TaxID=1314787 RepID=A0A9P4I4U3_9PEZI|nr:SIS domain-containing protein [Saccharata proteae CBS 121410]
MALSALPSPEIDDARPISPFDSRPCLKRKRSEALTPPLSADDPGNARTLDRAIKVLSTEATALAHTTCLYQTNPVAKRGLVEAVDTIERVNTAGGKLIICGVGKSGLIGMKTVATMKSLGLGTSFLHAAEAVHGDLGDVRPNDAIMFISFSGRTVELLNVLPHLPTGIPVIALTNHLDVSTCPLLKKREGAILLPAPIPEPEETSFGVCAPTTSTTVAIAIGDMLAIAAADRIHENRTAKIFKKNHPGGAIGARCDD